MPFEMSKNAELHILSSAGIISGAFTAAADVTAAMKLNAVPGVTDFGYDHEMDVQRRGAGQFGRNRPVGITDQYNGIKGALDVTGTEGENAVLAAINRIARASFVNANHNRLFEVFILANVLTDDGQPLRAHFLEQCKVDGVPKKIGPDAKRFSFQGLFARDFAGKRLRYFVESGDATPVTSVSFPTDETPFGWTDEDEVVRYALLALRYDGVKKATRKLELASAAAAGYYAETDTALTLHTSDGLAATDKLLVVYLV